MGAVGVDCSLVVEYLTSRRQLAAGSTLISTFNQPSASLLNIRFILIVADVNYTVYHVLIHKCKKTYQFKILCKDDMITLDI